METLRHDLSVEQRERLNRARDLIGDPMQRWNDRLVLEYCSKVKEYRSGRMALILDVNVNVRGQSETAGFVHEVELLTPVNRRMFIVLKADTVESKKLEQWNEKLVFIPDVQIVESPEGVIPSRVGFYVVENEIVDRTGDLLLFQSTFKSAYKFLPRVSNWKASPIRGAADESVVENIQSAPKIVKRVADYQSRPVEGKWRWLDIDAKMIAASLGIFIDADSVKVRIKEFGKSVINSVDVLLGPLNF